MPPDTLDWDEIEEMEAESESYRRGQLQPQEQPDSAAVVSPAAVGQMDFSAPKRLSGVDGTGRWQPSAAAAAADTAAEVSRPGMFVMGRRPSAQPRGAVGGGGGGDGHGAARDGTSVSRASASAVVDLSASPAAATVDLTASPAAAAVDLTASPAGSVATSTGALTALQQSAAAVPPQHVEQLREQIEEQKRVEEQQQRQIEEQRKQIEAQQQQIINLRAEGPPQVSPFRPAAPHRCSRKPPPPMGTPR